MSSKPEVILQPRHVELNSILTVKSSTTSFNAFDYVITDNTGRLIRKGAIANGSNEFRLCIVGFKTGTYNLAIGQVTENFTVL